MLRASGILLSISSLPSNYGIGCFSKEAYEFVDKLCEAGQSFWQILPLGPTGYGDSPYQSFSTFAGNPYFIDLEKLIRDGLLTKEECDAVDFGEDNEKVDYEKLYKGRYKLLKKAFENSNINENNAFKEFQKENSFWLEDYALFMAAKEKYDNQSWHNWDKEIRLRDKEALEKLKEELKEQIDFQKYMQFEFFSQWKELKSYANSKGIKIIGDIPIYVSLDSADAWANPQLFYLDSDNKPTRIAGCPPDGFSATGQLWGNPLYNWNYHKETGFSWWIKRIEYCYKLYDILRIDHFRGFDEYYSIPFGAESAIDGRWEKGPGIELFKAVEAKLGKREVIAEDLGYLTDSVRKLVDDCGFPGMKVLEFAFDSRDSSGAQHYFPYNYTENSVVYTGTHDNETIAGWFKNITEEERNMARLYLNNRYTPESEIYWDFVCLAMASVSKWCVIPMQDYLGLDNSARMNTPSTVSVNWRWRLPKSAFDKSLAEKIYSITGCYGRLPKD